MHAMKCYVENLVKETDIDFFIGFFFIFLEKFKCFVKNSAGYPVSGVNGYSGSGLTGYPVFRFAWISGWLDNRPNQYPVHP
jgi:hypothetical protein